MVANPSFPATYITTQLGTATTIAGTEVVELIQSGNSVQATLNLISTSIIGTATVTTGGTVGQVYTKLNSSNYNATWRDLSSFVVVGNSLSISGSTTLTYGLASTAALSVLGVTGASQATSAPIAGTAAQVLRVNDGGTGLTFGAVNLASSAAVTGTLPLTNGGFGNSVTAVQSAMLGFSNATTVFAFPAGQIPGTLAADSATTGNIGEYLSTSRAVASPLSLTNGSPLTVCTLSLGPGDWNVFPVIGFTGGTGTLAYYLAGSLSNTTNVLGTAVGEGISVPCFNLAVFTSTSVVNTPAMFVGVVRRSIAATTSFYLTAQSHFSVSTAGAWGALSARRVR